MLPKLLRKAIILDTSPLMKHAELNYRIFLEEELKTRKKRNPGYSLRAFARDLSIPAPKLSEILRGMSGLSATSAGRLADKLHLTEEEKKWFVSAVVANHGRSKRDRAQALQAISEIKHSQSFDEINLERFKIVADWYHFALLELTEVEGFNSEVGWISKKLGIDEVVTQQAIERLIDFGLLIKDDSGCLRQTQANLATPSGIPSREIRKHHSQILMKAQDSLENTSVEKRDFSALTMAFDESQIEEAKALIKEFRRNFDRLMKEGQSSKKRVYSLAVQFFPLDQEN